MEFLIADTFTGSLTRLTGQEQKSVKTTAFDLQLNPASPGLRFHKLDRAKDANFWSVRVNDDIRLIVHRTPGSLLLAYVGHHDDAYAWAERRRIEQHQQTGAAQLVEVREWVEEDPAPPPPLQPVAPPKPKLFAGTPDATLLAYGVPPDWLADVHRATEDTLFDLAPHLPQEAAEALLNLATGTVPPLPSQAPRIADPFAHPDAQRRFRVVADSAELERALDYPWEKWTVFLHPAQRAVRGARLHRAGAHLRVCRHRQDDRRAAPRGVPGPPRHGGAGAADHVFRHAGQRAEGAAGAAGRQ